MKKLFIVGLILAFVPCSMAWAADPDVGCGVGTQVMEGQSGRPAKLLASFTNGVTFQSVSITFGLLNCSNVDGKVIADTNTLRLQHYASQNFDGLLEDMAKGKGERLDVVAYLLDVRAEDRARFANLTQRTFEVLYSHDQVTVGELLDSLDQVMAQDEVFSTYLGS